MAPFCAPAPLLLLYPIVALFFLALRAAWELEEGGGEIICWTHASPGGDRHRMRCTGNDDAVMTTSKLCTRYKMLLGHA